MQDTIRELLIKSGVPVLVALLILWYGSENYGKPLLNAHLHTLDSISESHSHTAEAMGSQAEAMSILASSHRDVVTLMREIRDEQLRRDRE